MTLDGYVQLQPTDLKLPHCPLPRVGETVIWYSDARLVEGEFKGHNKDGMPLLINQFGNPHVATSFNEIRLKYPLNPKPPNWHFLPSDGRIFRPPESIIGDFKTLLNRRIPPGPSYLDLIHEIWSRGFEVFVVGGTVRDVISGAESHDVDLVTTMPLIVAHTFLPSMYRRDLLDSSKDTRGFIRIGGTPKSGDAFIDLKVFSDSLAGTSQATFGVGFERDVAHRDFSMNAVYYDPVNEALIDPTGNGVQDIIGSRLRLVCAMNDHFQHAQIFVRFFKFVYRGFHFTAETKTQICNDYATKVPTMKQHDRQQYIKSQLLSKCASPNDHGDALTSMRNIMHEMGVGTIWDSHFHSVCEELLQ